VIELLTYPARPVNGGALDSALAKVGAWAWQPKINDVRAIIHRPSGVMWNRHGARLVRSSEYAQLIAALPPCFDWLDVGLLGPRMQFKIAAVCIVIFDYIPPDSERADNYSKRRVYLEEVFGNAVLPWSTELADAGGVVDCVFLIPEFCRTSPEQRTGDPLHYYKRMQAENMELGRRRIYEGLVAKRTDKPYPVQLRSPETETPWMMKHRFDQ